MVNIGWVPEQNLSDIELGAEIIPPLEINSEGDTLEAPDIFSGMQKYNEEGNPVEEELYNVTEIVGMVRKGE